MSATVLVVEDEPSIQELVAVNLEHAGHRVVRAASAEDAEAAIRAALPDVVVLDWMLPGESGVAFVRRLRGDPRTRDLPVLMLTARAMEQDKVSGLEAGADDYLTKPFSPRELLARIRTVLRRRRAEVRQGRPDGVRAYRFDGWELNLNTRRLSSRDGQRVPLSNGEFSLLVVFLGAAQRVLSRDQLLDLSRLHNDEVYSRSIDVQILRLRRKIEKDPAMPRYLRTERGAGYVFGVPVETVY